MPYEDDYKMWLEKMLIESNPDWVCDGMYDMGFTHEWCEKYCGEDSEYVTPKCLHMYYHHIVKADRKTENCSEKPNNCEVKNYCDDCLYTDTCDSKEFFYACTSKATVSKMENVDEPQTQLKAKCLECNNSKACKENHWQGCRYEPLENEVPAVIGTFKDEPQTERSE